MTKRGAENQLNYDNWDEPEENVTSEAFEKATEATLKSRKLIVARRKFVQQTAPKLGLFKSFDGFGTNNSTSLGQSVFNFQKEEKHDDEYLKKLATLNKEVSAWIAKHVSEDPYCILTPIFTDYASHLSSIESSKTVSTGNSPIQPSANGLGLFTPKSSSPETSVNKFTAPTSSSSGSLPTTSSNSGFSFKSTSGNLPSSEFPAISKPPSFNFGLSTVKSVSVATPSHPTDFFSSYVASKSDEASKLAPTTSSEQAEDDDEYIPPKPEVKDITEPGSVYKVRCKLFYKKSDQWTERGLGNCHIIPSDDNKLQLLIRADTNLGNILLNILVSKELPMQLQKNNLTFACIPSPALPGSKEETTTATSRPIPFLIRVKTEETAKQLLAELDKYRGK